MHTSKFTEYIHGKSVAIVGSAPTRLKLDAIIDTYEIVVRMNQPADNARMDVLYIYPPLYDGLPKCSFVCALPDVSLYEANRYRSVAVVRMLGFDTIVECYNTLGSRPLTGTQVVFDILRHKPGKVFLTGLNCWISGEGIVDDADVRQRNKAWNDFNYLKDLCVTHEHINCDDHMIKLFDYFGKWIPVGYVASWDKKHFGLNV